MFRISLTVLVALAAFAAVLTRMSLGAIASPATATGCWPARTHITGTSSATLDTASGPRTYLLHVPPSYNGADAMPLVLAFHGITGTAAGMEAVSQLSQEADSPDGNFIVVYPQGSPGGVTSFNSGLAPPPALDDVAFVAGVLDALEGQLCVDAGRVYSTGFSNGAMMSVRLACSLSSRIAAIAPVAGVYFPPMFPGDTNDTCPHTTPVPLIAFHGTADTVIPFDGGMSSGFGVDVRLPIDNNTPDDDVLSEWAGHNACSGTRHETSVSPTVRLIEYDGCADDGTVKLYAFEGAGHIWPGPSSIASGEIGATNIIWQFFQAHAMPSAGALPDFDGDTVPDVRDPDNDNDGCPDAAEVQTAPGSEVTGGRRDPNNPWDYFNPTHDGKNRVDDIVLVLHQYHKDQWLNPPTNTIPNPAYNPDTDRTLVGPNAWNLGPPNGQQRVDDILNIVHQLFHDCS